MDCPLPTLNENDLRELDLLIHGGKNDKCPEEGSKSGDGSDIESPSLSGSEYIPNSSDSFDEDRQSDENSFFLSPPKRKIQLKKMASEKNPVRYTDTESEYSLADSCELSLMDDDIMCDMDMVTTTFPKTTTSNDKSKLKKRPKKRKPRRPCLYCGKFKAKLTLHLKTVHKSEEKVARALELSKEQQINAFELLRKKGMMKYNLKSMKEDKPLLCERGQVGDGVKMCTHCKAFIRRRYFCRHSKTCRRKFEGDYTKGISLDLVNENECIEFTDLLSRFNDDEVGKICKQNSIVRLVGKMQFNKHKRKKDKVNEARKAVMSKMRMLANLYKEFLKCSNDKTLKLEKMFVRSNFSSLEEAIENLSSHEDGSMKPGLKVGIGNLLKLSAKVLKGSYLIADDDESAECIDKFLAVLTLRWTNIFGDAEYQILKRRNENLREPVKLPDEAIVKKVRNYTVEQLDFLLKDQFEFKSPEQFISIRNLTVSRLTLFNARRGGEPSRLHVKDWIDAKKDKWVDSQRKVNMNENDKALLEMFKVIYQGGKGTNHLVPVLVPPDCVAALDFLCDESNRKQCEVHPRNYFLFPSTRMSLDHVSGWHCVKQVVEAAGVNCHITATGMRHRASTLYAQIEVPEGHRKAFFSHMGHSENMNKDVYQCPLGIQEVTKVGAYLASIDGLNIEEKKVKNDDTTTKSLSGSNEIPNVISPKRPKLANLVEIEALRGETVVPSGNREVSSSDNDSDAALESSSPPKKQKKVGRKVGAARRYVRWSATDSKILCDYFKDYIEDSGEENKGGLPGYNDIKTFLQSCNILEKVEGVEQRVKIIHTKIFNERKKYRVSYKKRLLQLTK